MKKKFILILIMSCILIVGCGKKSNKEVMNDLSKKINNLSSYNLKGNLEITNGEDMYIYNVEVAFQKDDLFKVSLTNTNNNHVQILLKNTEGVFVLTPSLNKSFKFQSDWPYNNSQIYLYQTILKDIENDNDRIIEEVDDGYVITSKVNYTNNTTLIKQKVYINKNNEITKIEVFDVDDILQMKMEFSAIDLKPTYDNDYFTLNKSLDASKIDEPVKEVSTIDTIIYPLYLPLNTHLTSQDVINTEAGERVIMTFDGDNSFMLIQETIKPSEDMVTIPVFGEPIHINDSLGVVSDSSVTWYSNGIEYYVTSDQLTETELVNIANSINAIPVGK